MVAQNDFDTESGSRPVRLSRRPLLPPLCPYYLARPRLYELLNRSPETRLVQVVAPAGFGKTTLLNAWTRDSSIPVAWLSLRTADGHLRAFIHALVSAVQAVIPRFGDGILTLLLSEQPPSADVVGLAMARELADLPRDLTLVLDGYESIGDVAVHQLLDTVVEYLPTNVRVVVASRTPPPLPLARLRVRGQLTEIGPSDLRFRSDEAEMLFKLVADGAMPDSEVRALNDRLEGWPSLLGLVALRLDQPAAFDAETRTPGGDEECDTWEDALRQVSDRDIEEFLIEEVLEAQPPDVQGLLLRTSLVDAFSAELCDALLRPEAPIAGLPAILDRLERHHLLIESVDESGIWYRCPVVLRDAFRRRLQHAVTPLELMMLRHRACEWLAERGLVDEAIEQAQACGDMVRVAELVEGSVASLLARRDFPALDLQLRMLSTDVIARRPRLILARAWLLNFSGRFEAIPTVLANLDTVLDLDEQELGPTEVVQLRAEGAVLRALVALVAGDGRQVMTLARQAYDVLPRFSGNASAFAAGYLGIGLHLDGQTDAAVAFLERVCREAPDPTDLDCLTARWALAWIGTMAARPRDVIRWTGPLVQPEADAPNVVVAWGHYLRGLAYYHLNRLSEAHDALLAADRLRRDAHRLAVRNTLLGLALVEQASGDRVAASDTLQALSGLPEVAESPSYIAVLRAFQARLAHAGGDDGAAREILDDVGTDPPPIMIESLAGSPSLVRAGVLVGLGGEHDLDAAEGLLDTLEVSAASVNDQRQLIGVQAARALLCQARGDTDGALQFLEQSITSAAPHGLVRMFVDLGAPMQRLILELDRRSTSFRPYLAHLVPAFPSSGGTSLRPTPIRSTSRLGPGLAEPLTWRETEVLRLLDARLSNQEIAGVLLISADTVKKHTINIYQKLHVAGRREAVARSYALGILPAAVPAPA